MKTPFKSQLSRDLQRLSLSLAVATAIALAGTTARASQAYGSIHNFDCVNDTGVPAHGSAIEQEDIRNATNLASIAGPNYQTTNSTMSGSSFFRLMHQ